MKKISIFVFVLALTFSFVSCEDVSYYKGSEWNCKEEDFCDKYLDLIDAKILELKEKYNFVCEYKIENPPNTNYIKAVLYDRTFTMSFVFGCHTLYAYYQAKLYFYGNDEEQLLDYESQKKYVDYLWEVTDLVAYDVNSDTNVFEEEFNYCIQNNVEGHYKQIHFDSLVGYIEYGVGLENDSYGYYYNSEGNSDLKIKCNRYNYKGLLKGTLESDLRS